jgi:cytoskeletal protein RodZ
VLETKLVSSLNSVTKYPYYCSDNTDSFYIKRGRESQKERAEVRLMVKCIVSLILMGFALINLTLFSFVFFHEHTTMTNKDTDQQQQQSHDSKRKGVN